MINDSLDLDAEQKNVSQRVKKEFPEREVLDCRASSGVDSEFLDLKCSEVVCADIEKASWCSAKV